MRPNSGWDYAGIAGIAGNGSFIGDGPPAPQDSQVAFITNDGSISQTGSVAPGTYTLTFKAVQRAFGNGNYEQIRVTMRGASSTKTFVWSGNTIVEERDGTGANVTKRFYAEGEQRVGGDGAGNYYYTRDHLGSIREVTDANGGLIAQYDYDPWGNAVVVRGKMSFDFGFTGHYFHQPSGMNLAMYRAYSPTVGRWISRDPIGERGGVNLYQYVLNDPIKWTDPIGLTPSTYYGGEGHFFVGGGLVAINCTDECGRRKTFRFWKICFGGAIGASGGGGAVAGISGKNCDPDKYKGYFYEAGASYGYGSAGIDVGYNSDGAFGLPGSLSGVVEGGGGVGLGAKIKSTWCYYIPL